ncbi:glutathione peroxidase 3 [Patagioenas fasciata monilis]|uniref:Glutathione peroxidase n=1 Tax=Patagioenas fasciata monilis TaxID=372326 RepID=A0A1V4KUJ6_PATFA|nr:glutathione peroxidase 3 [Patagioenas fasciata monilis]
MGGWSCSAWILPLFLAGLVQPGQSQEREKVKCYDSVPGTIYDYGALTIDGDEYIPFRNYAGKMYLELNALQNELGPYGLVVLGFPSNQFGKQEPGQNSEILPALKYVRPGGGFVPNFQLFQKGDVNGAKEQKVFTFLKNSCPPVAEEFGNPKNLFWEPLRNHDIKWNFEKFLVGPDGVPVMRWYHRANIAVVKNDIIAYMRQQQQQLLPQGQ